MELNEIRGHAHRLDSRASPRRSARGPAARSGFDGVAKPGIEVGRGGPLGGDTRRAKAPLVAQESAEHFGRARRGVALHREHATGAEVHQPSPVVELVERHRRGDRRDSRGERLRRRPDPAVVDDRGGARKQAAEWCVRGVRTPAGSGLARASGLRVTRTTRREYILFGRIRIHS